MNPNTKPSPTDSLQVEELEQEILLYHPEQGKAYNLNGTAAFIWSVCDGNRTVEDIAGYIEDDAPDTPEDEILADVIDTVESMVDDDLLTLDSPEN